MRRGDTDKTICGNHVSLRLATPEDAEYLFSLRMNPAYNAHLSVVTGTVEDQKNWLSSYQTREAHGKEFYYIIQTLSGTPCGTVRLYNITKDTFTWGSWILDHNKPHKAALESAVLSFGFGFEALALTKALVDVRVANTHAENFYRRFGMREISRDAQDIYFEYAKETVIQNKSQHLKSLR